ncbi:Adenosine deaminase [anaerobic digester metagenome]
MNILKVNAILFVLFLGYFGIFLVENQDSYIVQISDSGYQDTAVSSYFETIRKNPDDLLIFFKKMPKGGDIHIHASGAMHPDEIINISVRHGLYVNPKDGQLVDLVTGQPYNYTDIQHLVPVSFAYNNSTLYSDLVRFWTMKDFPYTTQSGHDWFFTTFDLIDPVTYYDGDVIATLRDQAADENMLYLELMTSQTNGDDVRKVLSAVNWNDNLSQLRYDLLKAGLAEIVERKVAKHSSYDQISGELSHPDGKNVTTRYIYEALRFYPKKEVFTDLLQAFEIANKSPVISGITLVGDEAAQYSADDYHLHMEMIAYLHSVYPDVHIELHAGELTEEIAGKIDFGFHISDAITTGNASRIGHGVAIKEEEGWENTLALMKKNNIPVEILLTSNEQILNISGPTHPVSVYLSHDVPVVLATDDPGVEYTNLTQEYVIFTLNHPDVSYDEIREINKNSIRYSFLTEEEKTDLLFRLENNLEAFEKEIVVS